MGSSDFVDNAESARRRIVPGQLMRHGASACALAVGSLLAVSPAASQRAAPAATTCTVGQPNQHTIAAGIDPPMNIDDMCEDPYFRSSDFVITSTTKEVYTGPGGPIPYTEIKGHFPARKVPMPPGANLSSPMRQQEYVFRIPDKKFFRNRTMQVQHPVSANTIVDNRLAFTNGAMSVNHVNAAPGNSSGHWRHHAAATKIAEAKVKEMYGVPGKIYSYYWGCSGGGQVAQAAAEGQTGVWDGIIPICPATRGNPAHAFEWQGHYQIALPAEKRARIASLRLPGNGVNATDGLSEAERKLLYDGLNADEAGVLTELLSAGFPLNELGANLSLVPLSGTDEIFRSDPSYEDDFWSKPGYAGANPPAYLRAAKMDGFATITALTRNAQGAITAIQLDPATIPPVPAASASPMGTTGQRFYLYAADGVTRVPDPVNPSAYGTLSGSLDRTSGLLTLTGNNNAALLKSATVGGKVRVNNRFLLAAYFYPRYSIIPGYYQYDQYRNADGTPKYPQRTNIVPDLTTMNQGAGVLSLGNIKTKTILFQNLSDPLAFPSWVAGYAKLVEQNLGPAKANQMLRLYYQEKGGHSAGGIVRGIFNQALIDLMAWAEKGVPPKPSSRYTFEMPLTQVVLGSARERLGLQPVVDLTVNGGDRAVVAVNQPVTLAAKLEMPPTTGQIVQYSWNVGSVVDAPTSLAKPQPMVNVTRTVSFSEPGTYMVRMTVSGQRDGLVDPANQTLVQNYKDVRVVVEAPPAPSARGGRGGRGGGGGPPMP